MRRRIFVLLIKVFQKRKGQLTEGLVFCRKRIKCYNYIFTKIYPVSFLSNLLPILDRNLLRMGHVSVLSLSFSSLSGRLFGRGKLMLLYRHIACLMGACWLLSTASIFAAQNALIVIGTTGDTSNSTDLTRGRADDTRRARAAGICVGRGRSFRRDYQRQGHHQRCRAGQPEEATETCRLR